MRYARLTLLAASLAAGCATDTSECKKALLMLDLGDQWCRRVAVISASKTCASLSPDSTEDAADLESCRNVTAPPLFANCLALTDYPELSEKARRECLIPRLGF